VLRILVETIARVQRKSNPLAAIYSTCRKFGSTGVDPRGMERVGRIKAAHAFLQHKFGRPAPDVAVMVEEHVQLDPAYNVLSQRVDVPYFTEFGKSNRSAARITFSGCTRAIVSTNSAVTETGFALGIGASR